MRCLICIDQARWEGVIRRSSRYLSDLEGEAQNNSGVSEVEFVEKVEIVCALEVAGPGGYELSVRGLLGRGAGLEEKVGDISEAGMERALSGAAALLGELCPGLCVETRALRGKPGEEVAKLASEGGFDAVFVGRGAPESPTLARGTLARGTVEGWKTNPHGDRDGFFLRLPEGGTLAVQIPPHRAGAVVELAREGREVEARGVRRAEHLHAYEVSDPVTGARVEAHEEPGRDGHGPIHIGHTARFITDHAPCDVVLLA